MADSTRQRKVADRIMQTVARTLERRIKDPRLGFITITDCKVTGDLQQATVYYTVLGTDSEKRLTAKALKSAKGIIRSEVGRALGIRLTPTIRFEADLLQESAASFEDTLARALKADREMAEAARDKEYAGEENPYREDDDEEFGDDGYDGDGFDGVEEGEDDASPTAGEAAGSDGPALDNNNASARPADAS